MAWTDGWLAGFWACALLFTGRYDAYAVERDVFLSRARAKEDT